MGFKRPYCVDLCLHNTYVLAPKPLVEGSKPSTPAKGKACEFSDS